MDNVAMDATGENQLPNETTQQTAERLFKQSELNEIVGRAKHEAVESFKRQQQHQQEAQQQQQIQNTQQYSPGQRQISEEDVKRLTGEELNRQREEWEKQHLERQYADAAKRIVDTYNQKIATGKDKYQDFDTVTNNVDMRHYPNVVQLLAEHVDNAHDVLYHLAQHRYKLGGLDTLCERNSQDAIYEIRRLSDSIKANEQSTNMKNPNAPLSQNRPSNTGTGSSGALSVRDYKAKYKV